MNTWESFVDFCDAKYQIFAPEFRGRRNQEGYEKATKGTFHQKCVNILFEDPIPLIKDIFSKKEQRYAWEFFRAYTGRKSIDFVKMKKQLMQDSEDFIKMAIDIMPYSKNRDLIKLQQMASLIHHYKKAEKAYALIVALQKMLPIEFSRLLKASDGYSKILSWGATPNLEKFWYIFQKHFEITYTAIRGQAAENLAQELDYAEIQSQEQQKFLKNRIEELEQKLETTQKNAYEQSIQKMAETMQNRPSPILHQTFSLYNQLQKDLDESGVLDPREMRMLISLEEILQVWEEMGICSYPKNLEKNFEIRSSELNEYNYQEGSPFQDEEDVKMVRCFVPGWKACGKVISSAVVKEISIGGK